MGVRPGGAPQPPKAEALHGLLGGGQQREHLPPGDGCKAAPEKGDFRLLYLLPQVAGGCLGRLPHLPGRGGLDAPGDGPLVAEAALLGAAHVGHEQGHAAHQ